MLVSVWIFQIRSQRIKVAEDKAVYLMNHLVQMAQIKAGVHFVTKWLLAKLDRYSMLWKTVSTVTFISDCENERVQHAL